MGATAAAAAEFFAAAATASPVALAATAVVGDKLLNKPDAPQLPQPATMPDPLEQQKAKERSIIEQMARRGRSASILTNTASQTLGGG